MDTIRQKLPERHWLMLALTLVLSIVVALFVDLKPEVKENFFFSSDDPKFQESAKIDKIFPSGTQIIVSVASPHISSDRYLTQISRLTTQLQAIDGVTSVESLAEGPKSFGDAEKSPFWTRLLIADSGRSSNLVVFASNRSGPRLIKQIESTANKFDAKDFRIEIAGAPYVAEMIRRNLRHDFRTFGLTSVLLFGFAMWALFRSLKLTLGMLATCVSAVLVTLIVQALVGEKIGILTANLGTIVFVVALSHLVYMTFNWQTLAAEEMEQPGDLGEKAWRMTLPASFWSMVCASLGFGSLLIVPAKPLRELGVGGVLGTVIALICAYLMYPAFLTWAAPKEKAAPRKEHGPFWERKFVWVSVATVAATACLSFGLLRLHTDPSILEYFKKGEQPWQGLDYIDRNGGSNPLTIVISAAHGARLDTKEQYEKMWDLQEALEERKEVGTVLSLPVLMSEGHRHAFAFLLSWNHLLNIMNEPKHQRVTSTFVTQDRTRAAFYLRMVERTRTKSRLEVVSDLKRIVKRNGFNPVLVGGVYELQASLAKLVRSSLVTGLFWLMLFFAAIAWIVGRNFRVVAAMIFSLSLVPICMLGGIGLLHVPIDLISAPATNVCVGMAIDSMVHLVFGVRRAQRAGKSGWSAWVPARREQWRGIVYSDAIIAAGFAIFAFSSFPPTQRFGLVVVFGTLIDILVNLFLLPLLGGAERQVASSGDSYAKNAR